MANGNNPLNLSKLYNISNSRPNNDNYNNNPLNQESYSNQPNNSMGNENMNMENQGMENNEVLENNISNREVPIMSRQQVREQLLPTRMNQNNFNMLPNTTNGEIIDFQNEYSMQNLNDLMRTQVGRSASIQFLIGSNNLVEKSGIILAVGDDYILLNEDETGRILVCDFYNIRFVTLNY